MLAWAPEAMAGEGRLPYPGITAIERLGHIAAGPGQHHLFCGVSDTVVFPLDPLEELRQDAVDAFGLHALQIRPRLLDVVLAQVIKQHRAIGSLRHREPGVEVGTAEAASVAPAGGYRRISLLTLIR